MFYYIVIIIKCKLYIVYIILVYILYLAFKRKYKIVKYNTIIEYK